MTIEQVIDQGFCVGCGGCKAASQSTYNIEMSEQGFYKTTFTKPLNSNQKSVANKLCPFSDEAENEDLLGKSLFKEQKYHTEIGYYSSIYTGHVNSDSKRVNSSSGGLTSWFAEKLFEKDLIDSIIHVGQVDLMFEYKISKSLDELTDKKNKKSRYYPVSYSHLIDYIMNTDDRILFIGIPCFVKSIRLLQKQFKLSNIKFVFSLLCGHMKSSAFSECLSWQLGVPPNKLKSIDFRVKKEGHKASDYFIESRAINDDVFLGRNFSLYGSDWGQGFFKHKACDYCDDIAGELADISFGDAWLPDCIDDYLGTNIVISRNKLLDKLLVEFKNELTFKTATVEDFIQSQAGNFRHRRTGLKVRIDNSTSWTPSKRMYLYEDETDKTRKRLYLYRSILSNKSNQFFVIAKKFKSISLFKILMMPYLFKYDQIRFGRKQAITMHIKNLYNIIRGR